MAGIGARKAVAKTAEEMAEIASVDEVYCGKKWEYLVIDHELSMINDETENEDLLDTHGLQGWELVNAISIWVDILRRVGKVRYYFKREL